MAAIELVAWDSAGSLFLKGGGGITSVLGWSGLPWLDNPVPVL